MRYIVEKLHSKTGLVSEIASFDVKSRRETRGWFRQVFDVYTGLEIAATRRTALAFAEQISDSRIVEDTPYHTTAVWTSKDGWLVWTYAEDRTFELQS